MGVLAHNSDERTWKLWKWQVWMAVSDWACERLWVIWMLLPACLPTNLLLSDAVLQPIFLPESMYRYFWNFCEEEKLTIHLELSLSLSLCPQTLYHPLLLLSLRVNAPPRISVFALVANLLVVSFHTMPPNWTKILETVPTGLNSWL